MAGPKSIRSDLWKLKIRRLWCRLAGKKDESLMLAFKEQRLKDELNRLNLKKTKQKQ
ncbi:hypothetical protein Q667_17965 [Marinobacter sp. C1S70]|uniref:hypothetical protein n=1 Tax=Marinobacter sp. C1S70 TaxID=1396859 RepID=UPI0003B8812E|nr:hypothetical protein [Marinobacter sp. C1S70]ERS84737.1 hypothetical protein Q667_17965 [Marinobacter sp. C1S70]